MLIRKIDLEDFEFIYTSICDLNKDLLDKTVLLKIFRENIITPNYLYLIAENEHEKLGFITFHIQNLLHHSGLVGEIQEFYVKADFRSQGVGRKLMEAVLTYADQNNLKSIEVTTNKKRPENIAIYESLGFNLSHNKFTIYR